ncbi:MAG: hypothetical protein QOD60_18 [Solirubrobacterales bacterium]|jgi:hypothetical protein|nr:hypothetical protein [Solirubrobacterales bacterium]
MVQQMASAQRTLVKSQPELWQLVDQTERLEGWSSGLLGHAAEISMTERDPEVKVAWEASAAEELASIEIVLRQDGWGTTVAIEAEREGATPTQLEGWLDAVLDELAEPEKRPFQGV